MPERDALLSQLRRGVVEYCVLAMLRHGERYGFDLVRELSSVDGMVTAEGTIYPVLSRLRRDGLVKTTWRESRSGPPRRYYELTRAGDDALTTFVAEWTSFRNGVERIIGGRSGDGRDS